LKTDLNYLILKVKNKTITKNSGLTLIEVLVAMGIFSVVISVAVGIFISGSNSQRKILELNSTRGEANYLMETISRELRMATAIDADEGVDPNSKDSDIEFTNYDNISIKYCRSDASGTCDGNGDYFSRDGEVINSPDIKIGHLIFYVTENFDVAPKKQPIVTISMKVKSTGQYGTSFILQNSVSLRLYQ
jgi:prepilin-type N-terminal cleavage/methylation domain-containing protein